MARLRLNIDDSQTEIQIDDTTTLPTNNGVVLIESEKISYQYATDRAIVGCTRGYDSTSAASHDQATLVTLLTEPTSNVAPTEMTASGAPTDNLTGVGFAEPGTRYTDLDNGAIYVNVGTVENPTWTPLATGGGTTLPGGPNRALQFNNLGSFGGEADLRWEFNEVRAFNPSGASNLSLNSDTTHNVYFNSYDLNTTFGSIGHDSTVLTIANGIGNILLNSNNQPTPQYEFRSQELALFGQSEAAISINNDGNSHVYFNNGDQSVGRGTLFGNSSGMHLFSQQGDMFLDATVGNLNLNCDSAVFLTAENSNITLQPYTVAAPDTVYKFNENGNILASDNSTGTRFYPADFSADRGSLLSYPDGALEMVSTANGQMVIRPAYIEVRSFTNDIILTPISTVRVFDQLPGHDYSVPGQLSVNANSGIGLRFDSSYPDANARNWMLAVSQFEQGDFAIMQSNTQTGDPWSDGVRRLHIHDNGNVDVNPSSLFNVNGTAHVTENIQVLSSGQPHVDFWTDAAGFIQRYDSAGNNPGPYIQMDQDYIYLNAALSGNNLQVGPVNTSINGAILLNGEVSLGGNIAHDFGELAIGSSLADPSAVLDVVSTSRGFAPPRMTTGQRDAIGSPIEGLVIYNTTTKNLDFYNGTVWAAV